MKYEGYKIGPVIRDIRKDKGLLIEEVAAKTGISVSTLGQVEQGGRIVIDGEGSKVICKD